MYLLSDSKYALLLDALQDVNAHYATSRNTLAIDAQAMVEDLDRENGDDDE